MIDSLRFVVFGFFWGGEGIMSVFRCQKDDGWATGHLHIRRFCIIRNGYTTLDACTCGLPSLCSPATPAVVYNVRKLCFGSRYEL
jgi:hypothetical protein